MARNIFVLALCLFEVVLLAQCFTLRNRRSAEEDQQLDHRYPEIKVDGETYKLDLVPRSHQVYYYADTVFTLKSSEDKQKYVLTEEKAETGSPFYEDAEHQAVILPKYGEDKWIHFDGVIGTDKPHVVPSVIEKKWWQGPGSNEPEVKPDGTDVEETDEEVQPEEGDVKPNEEEVEPKEEGEEEETGVNPEGDDEEEVDQESQEGEEHSRRRRSAEDSDDEHTDTVDGPLSAVYPKVLGVVDYSLYEKFEKNMNKVAEYVATFFNAVDLRYNKVDSPKVKVVLAKIVVVTDPEVDLSKNGKAYFAEDFVEDADFIHYDTAFVLGSSESQNAEGSICDIKRSTAFVQDDGKFGGLVQANNALGKLLKVSDDVQSLQDFVKTKDAKCLEDRYRNDY